MSGFFGGMIGGLQDAVDAIDALGDYYVSQAEMENLRTLLQGMIGQLEERDMQRTGAASFGQSTGGGYMGHHTSVAEKHVAAAIQDIAKGLNDYLDAVNHTERLAIGTDDNNADRLRALADAPFIAPTGPINDGGNCLDQPDFTDNDACTP